MDGNKHFSRWHYLRKPHVSEPKLTVFIVLSQPPKLWSPFSEGKSQLSLASTLYYTQWSTSVILKNIVNLLLIDLTYFTIPNSDIIISIPIWTSHSLKLNLLPFISFFGRGVIVFAIINDQPLPNSTYFPFSVNDYT